MLNINIEQGFTNIEVWYRFPLSINWFSIDRSAQSTDPEALEGSPSTGRIPYYDVIIRYSNFKKQKR
jgi:hypothetical protein